MGATRLSLHLVRCGPRGALSTLGAHHRMHAVQHFLRVEVAAGEVSDGVQRLLQALGLVQ